MGTPNKGIAKIPLFGAIWSETDCKGVFAIPLFGVPTVNDKKEQKNEQINAFILTKLSYFYFFPLNVP